MSRITRGDTVRMKLNNIRANVAGGAKQVDRQTVSINYYKVKCDDPLCGREFYELEALKHCPHCLSLIDEHNVGEANQAIIVLRTKSGEISVVN